MHCNDDIFRENEADRLFESMGVVISFLNKNKMTSLDLKIKIHKTYTMETRPVNHFIATCPPPRVIVPDKTAAATIARIPVSPCVATEYRGMQVRQLRISG